MNEVWPWAAAAAAAVEQLRFCLKKTSLYIVSHKLAKEPFPNRLLEQLSLSFSQPQASNCPNMFKEGRVGSSQLSVLYHLYATSFLTINIRRLSGGRAAWTILGLGGCQLRESQTKLIKIRKTRFVIIFSLSNTDSSYIFLNVLGR